MSSYQKLKQKNQQLIEDLHKLIMAPDTLEGITIKMKWHMQFQSEHLVWGIKAPTGEPQNFKGLISQITESK